MSYFLPAPRWGSLALCAAGLLATAGLSAQTPAAAQAASAAASVPATGASSASVGIFKPNANLHIEGIPAIAQSMTDRIAPYAEVRSHRFVGWHPKRPEMMVAHRAEGTSTGQLFWLKKPMGELTPITRHPDSISGATIEPTEGKYVLFEASKGGSEQFQIYRSDADGADGVLLTNPEFRHSRIGWHKVAGKYTGQVMYASVPLDKSVAPADRGKTGTSFYLMDPLAPTQSRKVAELSGTNWFGTGFNRSGSQLMLLKYLSATHSEIWSLDIASGKTAKVLPQDDVTKAVHSPVRFSQDGKRLLFVSDREGEFRELMELDLATKAVRALTRNMPHDVEGASEDDDETESSVLYVRYNVRGKSELRAFNADTLAPATLPRLPEGSVVRASLRRSTHDWALNMVSARSPGTIWTTNTKTNELVQWTQPFMAVDSSGFKDQEIITWKSFDGLEISGLINRASGKFKGKRPVLIDIHGGPEAQARIGFAGRQNYYINELGVTIIQPNVRGSSGFGKTFLNLDNGYKREDSVKDIGALFDWVAQQPDLDAGRVLVAGGSYGGYMSLAVATNYPERIAGAVDVVGISNFVTFLETTETYRRDLRRVEYGDERDPAMREFLTKISPLTNASKITKPLFVVQGKNDPRVPFTEAEQIVAKARSNGTPVWYLRAENEGHGFARKENADYYFYSLVRFMQETLLK